MNKKILDIKWGEEIGKRFRVRYALIACPDCRKTRWILKSNLHRLLKIYSYRCRSCAAFRMIKIRGPLKVSDEYKKILSKRYTGAGNPAWKGGRIKVLNGYIKIYKPGHYRADGKRYVLEHLLVWEKHNNRRLPKNWHIHHLNGITDDNRPENLIGLSSFKHSQILAAKAKRIKKLENKLARLKSS